MAFAIVSVLGIVLQVDAAGGGPDQKADAMSSDPATLATIREQSRWRARASWRRQAT
jgi:hypothetical protein